MGNCNRNLKNTCGRKEFAICVQYEGQIPEISLIEDTNCVSIEETTEDLYDLIGTVYNSIDLSSLGSRCLSYEYKDKFKVIEALLTHEKEICELKVFLGVEESDNEAPKGKQGININALDLKCLEDACLNLLDTPEKILQSIIDKLCEQEIRISELESKVN